MRSSRKIPARPASDEPFRLDDFDIAPASLTDFDLQDGLSVTLDANHRSSWNVDGTGHSRTSAHRRGKDHQSPCRPQGRLAFTRNKARGLKRLDGPKPARRSLFARHPLVSALGLSSRMYAKRFESLLAEQIGQTGLSSRAPDDTSQRFESLRGYGLLPSGRKAVVLPRALDFATYGGGAGTRL